MFAQRLRLEREAEHAEVGVEPEDSRRRRFPCGHRADAVREREREIGVPRHHVPCFGVEIGIRVANDHAPGLGSLVEQLAEAERCREPSVVAQPRRGLGDDVVRREQDVARVAEDSVVGANPLVRPIALPQERDERARVRVDDSQPRSFAAP